MFGHKCHHEMIEVFLQEHPRFSYQKESSSLFHEKGHLVFKDRVGFKDIELLLEVRSDFLFGNITTKINYLNSTFDPFPQDLFHINPQTLMLNLDLNYFDHRFMGSWNIKNLDFEIDQARYRLFFPHLNLNYDEKHFDLSLVIDKLQISSPNYRIDFDNISIYDETLKLNDLKIVNNLENHNRLESEFQDLSLKYRSSNNWSLATKLATYSLFNEAKELVDELTYSDANGDLMIDFKEALLAYDWFTFDLDGYMNHFSQIPVKLYINGGENHNKETFDIIYDSVTKTRRREHNESVLRLFLGVRLAQLLNIPYLLSVEQDLDNISLELRALKLVKVTKR